MRTKVKLFFDRATGKLNRTVVPEFHEHDHVLDHHHPEPGEQMVVMALEQYRTMSPSDYQPDVFKLEAHYAATRG